jgi:hypothetical protein
MAVTLTAEQQAFLRDATSLTALAHWVLTDTEQVMTDSIRKAAHMAWHIHPDPNRVKAMVRFIFNLPDIRRAGLINLFWQTHQTIAAQR